jgi:cytochrome c oxidase subunit 2
MPVEFYALEENLLKLELSTGIATLKPKYFDSYMAVVQSINENGRRNLKVDTTLALMVGFPIRFLTTSLDVLHSFAIPVFGIKLDAVPGRLNSCDVVIERKGLFYGQCSEPCGQGHGYMPIAVYVNEI